MNRTNQTSIVVVSGMILIAALTRLLPHWPNFTAIGAMALFGGAYFERRAMAVFATFIALYISDLLLNNLVYGSFYADFIWRISPWVYISLGAVLLVGFWLRGRVSALSVVGASLSASVLFFLLTNLGSWQVDPLYSKDFAGLLLAYEAGIPFFWNTLAGDLFFSGLLFGGYAWAMRRIPALTKS